VSGVGGVVIGKVACGQESRMDAGGEVAEVVDRGSCLLHHVVEQL